MLVTRISAYSGTQRTLELDITPEQLEARNKGALLQDAFPNLTPAEREFFKTGITQEEWDQLFPPETE